MSIYKYTYLGKMESVLAESVSWLNYMLHKQGIGGLFLAWFNVSLIYNVSTQAQGSNQHPVKYVLGVKQPGWEADHGCILLKAKVKLSLCTPWMQYVVGAWQSSTHSLTQH